MFTILSENWDANKKRYHLEHVINFLSSQGFRYIPEKELDEPYDGVNKHNDPHLTWRIRYFDFL